MVEESAMSSQYNNGNYATYESGSYSDSDGLSSSVNSSSSPHRLSDISCFLNPGSVGDLDSPFHCGGSESSPYSPYSPYEDDDVFYPDMSWRTISSSESDDVGDSDDFADLMRWLKCPDSFPHLILETPPSTPSPPTSPRPGIKGSPQSDGSVPKARLVPFLAECIKDPVYNPAIIKWLNEEEGVFLLVKPNEIARMWGERKGNSRMNYPSMSRGIRERRKYGYFEKVPQDSKYPKKLTFKWGPQARRFL